MLMIRPQRARIIFFTISCVMWKAESRLVCITFVHASAFMRRKRSSSVTPALLTRMSILPCCVSKALMPSRTPAAAMSRATPVAFPPAATISPATRSTASGLRAAQRTCAPVSPRRRAIDSPIPREAPVTRPAFPARSIFIFVSGERCDRSLSFRDKGFDGGDVGDVEQLHGGVDALDESCQDPARSDLHEVPHTHGDHLLHRLDPAHGRDHLADQGVADGCGGARRGGTPVRDGADPAGP